MRTITEAYGGWDIIAAKLVLLALMGYFAGWLAPVVMAPLDACAVYIGSHLARR